MSSNRSLFLAGSCGAIGMLASIAAALTHSPWLALLGLLALLVGTPLLIVAYVQLFREWRASRRNPPIEGIDVMLFVLQAPDESESPEIEEEARDAQRYV